MDQDIDSLLAEYAPFVWRVLLHLGVPEAQLDDVSQEVLLAICRKIDGFQGRSTLRTWIYGICRNLAKTAHRSQSRRREVSDAGLAETTFEGNQERTVLVKQTHAALLRALDRLSEEQRSVFVFYEIEELAMEDIAETIGAPLTTCYSRLEVARKKVEAAMLRWRKQGAPGLKLVAGGKR